MHQCVSSALMPEIWIGLTLSDFPDDFLCWGLQADKTTQVLLLTALAYSMLASECTCAVCWAVTHLIANLNV